MMKMSSAVHFRSEKNQVWKRTGISEVRSLNCTFSRQVYKDCLRLKGAFFSSLGSTLCLRTVLILCVVVKNYPGRRSRPCNPTHNYHILEGFLESSLKIMLPRNVIDLFHMLTRLLLEVSTTGNTRAFPLLSPIWLKPRTELVVLKRRMFLLSNLNAL